MNNKEPANTAKLILMFFYASWAPQSLALLPLLAEIENEKIAFINALNILGLGMCLSSSNGEVVFNSKKDELIYNELISKTTIASTKSNDMYIFTTEFFISMLNSPSDFGEAASWLNLSLDINDCSRIESISKRVEDH